MKSVSKLLTLFLAIIIPSIFLSCNAQKPDSLKPVQHFWVQNGLGISSLNGLSGLGSINFQNNQWVFTGRLGGTFNDEWFSDESQSVLEIGALAGVHGSLDKSARLWYSFAAGFSFIRDKQCIENCGILSSDPAVNETRSSVGIPLEAQFIWRPLSFAGVGLQGAADLNPVVTYASAHLVLQLGFLR